MEVDKTTMGTPCSPHGEEAWTAVVERTESELHRRICGAVTPAGTPCKLGSSHVNGRWRFHGGHPGVGAPLGNTNALVHGLCSRRLRRCWRGK